MPMQRLLSGLRRLRNAGPLRVGGAAVGLGVASGLTQGFYLWSLYRPLPEPRGPLRGVAAYLREKREQHQQSQQQQPQADEKPKTRTLGPLGAVTLARTTSRGLERTQSSQEEPQPRPRKNILFVGDSLVTGVGCSPDECKGPAMPRACAAFLAKALRVDVQWAALGQTGADVAELNKLLPAVKSEVLAAQERGGHIDAVVVICGLNDVKYAYTSLPFGSLRRTANGFKGELSDFVEALHNETGVQCAVVLPSLPVHHAPVFQVPGPFRPIVTTVASWWDDQKVALAERAHALQSKIQGKRICFHGKEEDEDDSWWGRKVYWAADGIHPNDEGYRIWGEHIGAGIIKQALLQGPVTITTAVKRPVNSV